MFWVGLFSGIVVYCLLTLVMVFITKRKMKKEKAKKQEYDILVKEEIERNKRG